MPEKIKCQCLEKWGENSPDCFVEFKPKPHASHAKYCPPCSIIARRVQARRDSRRKATRKQKTGEKAECYCGCGLVFIKRSKSHRYSPDCKSSIYKRYRNKQAKYQKSYKEKNFKKNPSNTMHKCKCPRCGKEYKKRMHWSGRGTPRIYCEYCKELIANGRGPCDSYRTSPKMRFVDTWSPLL